MIGMTRCPSTEAYWQTRQRFMCSLSSRPEMQTSSKGGLNWQKTSSRFFFPSTLFTHDDTKVNLNWINGEATSLWKISIVFVLPAWRQATVTAFILPIKLGEFECDERGLRLAREEGDGAQCAWALPAVPATESHYGWASQLYWGGGASVCVCLYVCVCACVIRHSSTHSNCSEQKSLPSLVAPLLLHSTTLFLAVTWIVAGLNPWK